MNNRSERIFVAGHAGLAGSAIVRQLQKARFSEILTRTHADLDLSDRAATRLFFREEKPDFVVVAAAKVGGILANSNYPADFLFENLNIETSVIESAYEFGVKRLIFLGSSCIYPRDCPQPMREEYLLSGPLELTNRPYALAKIAGIEMCWALNRQYGTRFVALMPTNLYGPNDNYDLQNSHVLPALLRKMHAAKVSGAPEVVVWGSGQVRREFLHSDDLGRACVHMLQIQEDKYLDLCASVEHPPLFNVGTGVDMTIEELARTVAEVVGFEGRLAFDRTKPDGTPRKLLDVSLMRDLGWRAEISLHDGLRSTYNDYLGKYKQFTESTISLFQASRGTRDCREGN